MGHAGLTLGTVAAQPAQYGVVEWYKRCPLPCSPHFRFEPLLASSGRFNHIDQPSANPEQIGQFHPKE